MKKNFFLIYAALIQAFSYTNRLNSMPMPTNTSMNMSSKVQAPLQMGNSMQMGTRTRMGNSMPKAPQQQPTPPQTTPAVMRPPRVTETQLTWPQTIDAEKTKPLGNKIVMNSFNEAEKLYQEALTTVKNIETIRDTFAEEFLDASDQSHHVTEKTLYKKGVIMEKIIQFEKK